MDFDLEHLRALLKNVPASGSFRVSVRLLEDAFDWLHQGKNPPWREYRRGRDIPFFGQQTLRALLGDNFRGELGDRLMVDCASEQVPQVDLRSEMQRYVVVGRRRFLPGWQTECVMFHSGQVSFLDGAEHPPVDRVSAMELVRIRAGLMNRRQAHLLANHLNRFRRNHHHAELLDWSVVRGPLPNSSARNWFDAVAGNGCHLQHSVGDFALGGLGTNATESLALYLVKRKGSARPEQVFAYGAPRCLLPERFEISAVETVRSSGIPEGQPWLAVRAVEDRHAYQLAELCERAGLLDGEDRYAHVTPGDFWGPAGFGAPEPYSESPGPAHAYATSFSREEALRVMRSLRAHGYRRIRAHRFGTDGSHVRPEVAPRQFNGEALCPSRTFDIAGEPGLRVKVSTNVTVQDRYTPWESRFDWEKEALMASWNANERARNA